MGGVLVAGLLAHQRYWVGEWAGSSYYLRSLLILLGPVVVAAAAWQGGREDRRGVGELFASTSRPQLHRTLAAVASPASWAAAAFLLVAGAAGVATTSRASYGGPLLGVLASALAAVLALAALGYAAGRLVRWRVTTPLVALATFIAIAALSYRSDGVRFLSPGVDLTGLPDRRPVGWWPVASAGFFLALAAAVVAFVATRRRWLGVPLLALAVLAGVPIVRAGEGGFTVDRRGEALVCRQNGAVQVCLLRRHSRQLAAVAAVVQPVLDGLDAHVRLVESYRSAGTGAFTLNPLYIGPTLTSGAEPNVLRHDVATGLLRWDCGPTAPYPSSHEVGVGVTALAAWLEARPSRALPGIPVGGLSEGELLSVTRAYRTAVAGCNEASAERALAPLHAGAYRR